MKPTRIQRKRTKGWRMPENTVSVSRPGKWGNPFKIGMRLAKNSAPLTAAETVEKYREALADLMKSRGTSLEQLRGKNLACYCPLDQPCHANLLLELANQ